MPFDPTGPVGVGGHVGVVFMFGGVPYPESEAGMAFVTLVQWARTLRVDMADLPG